MKQNLNDISTLKPGMKIYSKISENTFTVTGIYEKTIEWLWNEPASISMVSAENKLRTGIWEVIQESPYDWKKELEQRQDEFISKYRDAYRDWKWIENHAELNIEALTKFIEEIINKSK